MSWMLAIISCSSTGLHCQAIWQYLSQDNDLFRNKTPHHHHSTSLVAYSVFGCKIKHCSEQHQVFLCQTKTLQYDILFRFAKKNLDSDRFSSDFRSSPSRQPLSSWPQDSPMLRTLGHRQQRLMIYHKLLLYSEVIVPLESMRKLFKVPIAGCFCPSPTVH